MTRPSPTEYAPYFEKYTSLVQGNNIIASLTNQIQNTRALLKGLSEDQGNFRYAPDKWSIKEVIGHLIDTERIFAYRALRFARHDQTHLSSFDENAFVTNSNYTSRHLAGIAEEFDVVRQNSVYLFKNLDQDIWLRSGPVSDYQITVRALAYVIAGHELHHLNIIRSRYLNLD